MQQADQTFVGDAVRGKLTLDGFLSDIDRQVHAAVAQDLDRVHAQIASMDGHLDDEPDLKAQTAKLADALPGHLAAAPIAERRSAVRTATALADDLKTRWIAAENPPLVDEIDARLAVIGRALDGLGRPDAAELRAIARRMDGLGEAGRRIEGIERRLRPWALLGSMLFLLGLVLLVWPTMLGLPRGMTFWLVLLCFGLLPGLAAYYAFRTLPRTRADNEIDRLNRAHFLPHGGIYFPEGERPAGVILIDYTPPEDPPDLPPDPRKQRDRPGARW